MKSLRELYKVGRGPSSSHTMGPEKASKYFLSKTPDADRYEVILYGSLAATGKGHRTDAAIEETIAPKPVKIVFDNDTPAHTLPHANTMDFIAYKEGEELLRTRILSVGGGDIRIEGCPEEEKPEIYKENSFTEIAALCKAKKIRLSDYVFENEGPEIRHFLYDIWQVMKEEIQGGLTTSGILPGGLNVERVAQLLYNRGHIDERPETKENRIVCAYAFAASEQNADCKTIVTAPTCGACAVVPSVLKYMTTSGSSAPLPLQDLWAISSSKTPRFRERSADVRRRWVLLALWRRQDLPSFLKWASTRSNMQQRCRLSIIWDSPATPFAVWCRSPALSVTPWRQCAPSTRCRWQTSWWAPVRSPLI